MVSTSNAERAVLLACTIYETGSVLDTLPWWTTRIRGIIRLGRRGWSIYGMYNSLLGATRCSRGALFSDGKDSSLGPSNLLGEGNTLQ